MALSCVVICTVNSATTKTQSSHVASLTVETNRFAFYVLPIIFTADRDQPFHNLGVSKLPTAEFCLVQERRAMDFKAPRL